jgi:hypothetical protein
VQVASTLTGECARVSLVNTDAHCGIDGQGLGMNTTHSYAINTMRCIDVFDAAACTRDD